MPTRLKFPRGSTVYFLLSWTRDGAQLDLTGAALLAILKSAPDCPDEAALQRSDDGTPLLNFTWRGDLAGLAILQFKGAATANLLRCSAPVWRAQATLPNGDVIVADAHQGPVLLTPYLGNSLDPLWGDEPPVDGVTQTLEPGGTVALLPPAMSNYILNRPDLVGLGVTVAGVTKLSGLTAAELALLSDGAIVRLTLAGSIVADYKLVTGTPAGESQWNVVCDHAAGRYWKLCANPSKEGAPTTWSATLSKFKQILDAAGALALADDADAFVIPD